MSHKAKAPLVSNVEEIKFEGSSNVISAKYIVDYEVLDITFKSGTYRYDGIPQAMWEAFKEAPSKGNFVNTTIVGPDRKNPIYKGVKVDG